MILKIKEIIKWLLFLILGCLAPFKKKFNGKLCLNIIGDINSVSGLGNTTRAFIRSIDGMIEYNLIDLPMSVQSKQQPNLFDAHISLELMDGVNVFVGNPDILLRAFRKLSLAKLLRNYNVGLWFWELENVPSSWMNALKVIDEVWTQSEFVKRAFKPICDNTFVMPFNLDYLASSNKSRMQLGLPESGNLIVFTFDFLSHAARKNPELLVDVFKKAFQDGGGVNLILKTVNGNKNKQAFDNLKAKIGDRRDIILIDEYWEQEDVGRLMELADCYVSLHRSEGLGSGMAEAMRLKTLVLATGYSGNLEFMDEDNSFLVSFNLTMTPKTDYPYAGKNVWADAELDDAINKMRMAFRDKKLTRELVAKASLDVAKYNSRNQWGWISERVNEITKLNLDDHK